MSPAASTEPLPILAWGVGARTLHSEAVSGDLHVVTAFPGGALAVVIDGLGHGVEAAEAASAAARTLMLNPGAPVIPLVEKCHAELRKTRGVVMSLASFRSSDESMTWLGIGNVEGVLFHADPTAKTAREALLLRGGVVGYQLPPMRAAVLSVTRGDTLILATDGIASHLSDESPIGRDPQSVADDILARCAKRSDDALVLVARYLGAAS